MSIYIRCIIAAIFAQCLTSLAENHKTWSLETDPTPEGFKIIRSMTGIQVRYKEHENNSICETTPGVRSFAGFIDLAEDSHTWFWFFESRNDPVNDPITFWTNGGPGSDSNIGLFQEIGPCFIDENIRSIINTDSWSERSNLLIISQPIGVGFSYSTHERGTLDPLTGVFQTDAGNDDGEYYPAISDRNRISKTSEAAQSIWYVLQAFYGALKTLDPKVNSTSLHIFTESYGGHYGPSFFRHIQEQNYRIQNKSIEGIVLNLGTLGIINGLVDLAVQAPAYAKFLRLNSHGIFPLNESMLAYMDFSLTRSGGCEDYVSACAQSNRVTTADLTICSQATILCRADVETMYQYGGRHPYDIRQKDNATEGVPQDFFVDYLNLPQIQKQLGVRTKYATNNQQVYWEFAATGDFAFPDSLHDLVWLLDQGLNIALAYGDADYECNWFGGEAISFEVASRGKLAGFANLSYMPFAVDGTRYGETRQQNGLSFTRVYNAGHKAPWYQPEAMRVWFERAIGDGLAIADGSATAQKRFPDCNPLD